MQEQDEEHEGAGPEQKSGSESLANLAARMTMLLREDQELRRAALGVARWLQQVCGEAPELAGAVPQEKAADMQPAAVPEAEPLERHEVTLSIGGQRVRVVALGEEEEFDALEARNELQPAPAPGSISTTRDLSAEPLIPVDATESLKHCARLAERASMDLERLAAESLIQRKQDVAAELASAWSHEGWTFWALDPGVRWPSPEELRDLVAVYANLAQAVRLVVEIRGDEEYGPPYRERAFTAIAETQSALRVALEDWAGIERDRLQCDVFRWLNERTRIDRVFVARYMRLDDACDPRDWKETRIELKRLADDWREGGGSQREQRKLRSKLEYHLGRIKREAGHRPVTEDWCSVDAAVCRLLELGVPASNLELREALLHSIELIPEDFAPGEEFERVLHEVDAFLTEREERAAASSEITTRERNADVLQVADLLRGRELVLIGGVERPTSKALLVRDFELSGLHWISTDAHRSYTTFEPAVARPETAVVILAIRWASHSYENVKTLCDKHGKPYVRLPGGYNPNQVARQILSQVSTQLGA